MNQQGYNAKANAQEIFATRALLVSVRFPQQHSKDQRAAEEEMIRLAKTAGLDTVHISSQNLKHPNSITLIGKGKVEEIAEEIKLRPEIEEARSDGAPQSIDIVLFSCDLSPVHQRNLEKALNRRVLDRSELILDIFAQHAVTRDGRIQVELAQLQYLKPRLSGRGVELSRLGGGVGTRGPGETKLEVDRRKIDQRIRRLTLEYEKCKSVGEMQRRSRKRHGAISIALVGYTNAGKSTFLNRITKSDVVAKDQLFSTLDTTTRKVHLLDGTKLLLSDTVGFIENLPPILLDAFRATLAEVVEADALIHVLDASNEHAERHIESVMEVLRELNADDRPMLTILNKRDAVENLADLDRLKYICQPSVEFSALKDKELIPIFDSLSDMANEIRENRKVVAEEIPC